MSWRIVIFCFGFILFAYSQEVAAVFNGSFKTERTVYGVYPMKDGEPDEKRASKRYVYRAYVARNSTDTSLLENAEKNGRSIVVERGASVLSLLKKKGANIFKIADYSGTLDMLV